MKLPPNARLAPTLAAAAEDALGHPAARPLDVSAVGAAARRNLERSRRWVRGVYSGGTLCAEAQLVLRAAGEAFWSNAPVPGALPQRPAVGHILVDYGADEYTVGRPHPMIDPAVRNEGLREALRDPSVAVVLLDVVIGHGAHDDPAGAVARWLASTAGPRPAIVASVTGTEADPQGRARQVQALEAAGVIVGGSNAEAAAVALAIARG
jgi:FdrA protein